MVCCTVIDNQEDKISGVKSFNAIKRTSCRSSLAKKFAAYSIKPIDIRLIANLESLLSSLIVPIPLQNIVRLAVTWHLLCRKENPQELADREKIANIKSKALIVFIVYNLEA